jgi:hypothetical protein
MIPLDTISTQPKMEKKGLNHVEHTHLSSEEFTLGKNSSKYRKRSDW